MSHHLTVLYGGYSRYDLAQSPPKPFSGSAGDMFIHRTFDLIKPAAIDIRICGTPQMAYPFVHNTRFLLLGPLALKEVGFEEPNIFKERGIVHTYRGRPAICTFHPIDCWDFKKTDFNSELDEEDDKEDPKDVGPTSRGNYLHWAMLDYRKLMTLPWPLPAIVPAQKYIAPPANAVVDFINSLANCYAIIDIETRRQDHSLDCIGILSGGVSLVIPFYSPNNGLYYSPVDTARIYRALHNAFLRPSVLWVGHNITFDLSVLCFRYGLPVPTSLYDTMLGMHREFPQLEKSLSHALSLYTFATRNHKADAAPNTSTENFRRLLDYNAGDLLWTREVFVEQVRRQQGDSALATAVGRANATLRTCLIISFTGIRLDLDERDRQIQRQLFAAQQWTRVLRILTDNPEFNPGSTQQCAAFIYHKLGYPIEERTEAGAPSTGTKQLYLLHIKQPNPIFPLIIAAREANKAASMLKFRTRTA